MEKYRLFTETAVFPSPAVAVTITMPHCPCFNPVIVICPVDSLIVAFVLLGLCFNSTSHFSEDKPSLASVAVGTGFTELSLPPASILN